ncbi:hypothetical protein BCV70DRAFT_233376 [Testicularia cyperi]|uniref:Uncharacterized protein n=1 Tax=Testicularia cyperi TaxID=1882483 RepID=A0A317XJ69_9BASI|nr:hypothetical protein BCV70DRAFT_233376 [Testicularia cyperi]
MHGSCSKAFSTAAVKKHVSPIDTMASEQDRDRVLDILTRMDTQDAERASQRKAEDSDDFNTEDEADENVDAPEFRVEDVEAASTEQLLAMLTPAQRARFERAVQSPEAASRLMKKLDRKATAAQQAQEPSAGHDKPTVPLSSPSSFIQQVSSSRSSDAVVLPGVEKEVSSRMPWQSIPWFEASQGCPAPMIKTPNIFDSVAQELRKILSVPAPIEAGVDLTFNLCTVLMAYSYLLRHFDLESLASVVLQRASTPLSPQEWR